MTDRVERIRDLSDMARTMAASGVDPDQIARELLRRTDSPVSAIKAVVEATGMGLGDAKWVVHRNLGPQVRDSAKSLWDDSRLGSLSVRMLLRLYSQILTELIGRGVVRSRNAPAGDLAESIVAKAYRGELAARSEKSWDIRTADGVLLQVKCRVAESGGRRTQVYSPFRSWDFDACVFVNLDAATYDIDRALEVPVDQVKAIARENSWVAGHRVTVSQIRGGVDGAVEVTDRLREAYEALDRV